MEDSTASLFQYLDFLYIHPLFSAFADHASFPFNTTDYVQCKADIIDTQVIWPLTNIFVW